MVTIISIRTDGSRFGKIMTCSFFTDSKQTTVLPIIDVNLKQKCKDLFSQVEI